MAGKAVLMREAADPRVLHYFRGPNALCGFVGDTLPEGKWSAKDLLCTVCVYRHHHSPRLVE